MNDNAAFFEGFGQFGTDFFVFVRDNPWQCFDQGHFAAKRTEHRRKFNANCTCTDYQQRRRNLLHTECLPRRQDVFTVEHRTNRWNLAGACARCQNRVFGGDHTLCTIGSGYYHTATVAEHARTIDHIDFVLFHQKGHTGSHLLDHTIFVLDGGIPVNGWFSNFDAKLRAAMNFFEEVCGMQERLGRNTTDIQTHTTHILTLNNSCFETELCRTNRSDIAAWACTDNHDIIRLIAHNCTFRLESSDRCLFYHRLSNAIHRILLLYSLIWRFLWQRLFNHGQRPCNFFDSNPLLAVQIRLTHRKALGNIANFATLDIPEIKNRIEQ